MGWNKSLNPFIDDVFRTRLTRRELASNTTRYELLQQGAMAAYAAKYLDGTKIYKGIVLYVEKPGENDSFFSTIESLSPRGVSATEFHRVRVRIPELHAHIPEPCDIGTDCPARAQIEMHPLFVGSVRVGPEPQPGDTVRVSFNKGPKSGIQAGGIYHGIFQAGVGGEGQGALGVCQALAGLFEGPQRPTSAGPPRTAPVGPPQVLDNSKTVPETDLYNHLFTGGDAMEGLENKNLCIAMVANAKAESGLSYEIAGDRSTTSNRAINVRQINRPGNYIFEEGLGCSFGLWQYNVCGGLGMSLLQEYGANDDSSVGDKMAILKSYDKQVKFMVKHVRALAGDMVNNERTISYWVRWFVTEVERPANPTEDIRKRTEIAHVLDAGGLGRA